jgi:hypothetical protein
MVWFNSEASRFFFCLDVLSTDESWLLKSPTIIVSCPISLYLQKHLFFEIERTMK